MNYTIPELRDLVLKNVLEVYEVFKNHFGEQYVDLQDLPDDDLIINKAAFYGMAKEDGSFELLRQVLPHFQSACLHECNIYVWWPKVKVTNEYGKSVTIHDLYAKITLDCNGFIPYEQPGFLLNRTTYPAFQFDNNYMHSHVHYIPKSDFTEFQSPCLGNGPIKHTIVTLKSSSDTAMWMLFCEELSRYVTVESLTGIPYHRLEDIGRRSHAADYQSFCKHTVDFPFLVSSYSSKMGLPLREATDTLKEKTKEFTAYYLQHGNLGFSFQQGKFICSLSYYDYIIDVSNCFINYFNTLKAGNAFKKKLLYQAHILKEVQVADGKFYLANDDAPRPNYGRYRDRYVLTFKGERKTIKILENAAGQQPQKTTLFNNSLAMYMLENILNILNFRFVNEYTNNTDNTGSQPAEARKTVAFL